MKLAPINVLQVVLMAVAATAPVVGADWPGSATWMHLCASAAVGILGAVNLVAPPPAPSTVLGPQGLKAIHVVTGIVSTFASTIAAVAAAQPHNASLAIASHVATTLGGVTAGLLGILSPQAYLGPIAQARLRAAQKIRGAARQPPGDPQPETPRAGKS